MNKLIYFEFYKAKKNLVLIYMIGLICLIFIGYGLFYVMSQPNFMQEIKNESRIMIEKIRTYDDSSKEMIQQNNLYHDLLYAETWQEAYTVLNEIDQLYIDYPSLVPKNKSDLPYELETNIEVREYCLENEINPDEKSGYLFIDFVMERGLDIFMIVFVIFVLLLLHYDEYDNNSVCYYYSLNYSYKDLMVSKLFVSFIIAIIVILIPFVMSFIIMTMLYGIGNQAILIESSKAYANLAINNAYFMTITNYIKNIIEFLLIDILFINTVINWLKSLIFHRYIVLFGLIGILLLFHVLGFSIYIHTGIQSQYHIYIQTFIMFFITFIGIILSIVNMKKLDIRLK